jgi:hypothetical protein
MHIRIYIILIITYILSACHHKKANTSKEEVMLNVALKGGQELIYDVEYAYTLNKPITIGKEHIYYRNIYQNLQISILEKNKSTYTLSTKIRHLRWEDYNKDSLLVALFDSKFKHLNIGYGDNFMSTLDLYTKKLDTILINPKGGYHTVDTFSYIPFFFEYPKKTLAVRDSINIQLPIGKNILYIDSIWSDRVLTHLIYTGTKTLKAKYTIDRIYGNIREGSQEYVLDNDSRYKRIAIKFSQMK